MLPKSLAFVDIETTGMRHTFDRIIEIGVLRVEDNKLVNSYQSLINPSCYLPPEITGMTGITSTELEHAPTFRQISDDLEEILSDCIFVAHNVRFDYGFLKHEFKRLGISFAPKHFCTVKLSKYLFPRYKRHNLDSIIERFGFECTNRHRAFDDAKILWDFYQAIHTQFPAERVEAAIQKALEKPSLPANLPSKTLESLPETPGVYIFYGSDDAVLYVGKSINIKDRVLSHFSQDHSSSTEMKISQQITRIETISTSGELGALLKESSLIKSLQPLYNKMLRISHKLTALKRVVNKDGFETVEMKTLSSIPTDQTDKIMGIFRSQRKAKDFLISVVEEHGLCEKILGLEKTRGACFGYRLNRCKGACIGEEMALKYNMRFIMAFSKHKIKPWPFKGPIVIEEQNELEGTTEKFIIDKWCFLGTLTSDVYETQDELYNDILFDVDTYKILERYVRSEKNLKSIKVMQKNNQESRLFFERSETKSRSKTTNHSQSSLL